MSAKEPVLHVPTSAAREAAVRAIYDAGLTLMGEPRGRALATARLPMTQSYIRFATTTESLIFSGFPAEKGLKNGIKTQVNSVRHLIWYVRRHWPGVYPAAVQVVAGAAHE